MTTATASIRLDHGKMTASIEVYRSMIEREVDLNIVYEPAPGPPHVALRVNGEDHDIDVDTAKALIAGELTIEDVLAR